MTGILGKDTELLLRTEAGRNKDFDYLNTKHSFGNWQRYLPTPTGLKKLIIPIVIFAYIYLIIVITNSSFCSDSTNWSSDDINRLSSVHKHMSSYDQHILDVEKTWMNVPDNTKDEDLQSNIPYKSEMFGDTRRPHNNYFQYTNKDVSTLPRFAWVLSITKEYFESYSYAISMINCYCAMRGIPLYIEPQNLLPDGRDFFQARWRNVQKYLPHFQWIFHTDIDIFIANYSMNILDWLDDRYDVILFTRETQEIYAGITLIRNSQGGREFVERWLNFSDDQTSGRQMNADNGDLLELLLSYVNIEAMKELHEVRLGIAEHDWVTYKTILIPMFHKALAHLEANNKLAKTVTINNSILIYQDRSAFLRSFEAGLDSNSLREPPSLANRFIPTDFIIHMKDSYRVLKKEFAMCLNEKSPLQSVPERWLSLEEARKLMIKEKVWTWSGCFENGINICKKEA